MSTLLNQPVVIQTLSILGLNDPCGGELYLSLLGVYSGVSDFITSTDDVDLNSVHVVSVNCHHLYNTQDGSPRLVRFSISRESDIDQIFLYLIFMQFGLISHMSRINLVDNTSQTLIAIASNYVNETDPPF